MSAAASSTPASRPLPLFYALSQASRAVTAAWASERWRLRMHGLSCPELEGDTLAVPVLRAPARRPAPDEIDAFAGLASATGSAAFPDRATLGALWCSLPELSPLMEDDVAPWPRPLRLIPDAPDPKLAPWGRQDATIVGFGGEPEALLGHLHAHFPTTAPVRLFQPQGLPHVLGQTRAGLGIRVSFDADRPDIAGHLAALDRIAPGGVGFDERWLRPGVSGMPLSPLMTWWALLFGLSMLARYEPGSWTAALALDRSPLAAALAHGLRVAVARVPELVLGALIGPGSLDTTAR